LAAIRDALRAAVLREKGYDFTSLPEWARFVPRRLPHWIVRRAMYDLEDFPAWAPPGRALDVGCGNCWFLSLIRRHGWDVMGVDTSAAAATAARESFGIRVHVGELEDAPLIERGFDFIHMSHVIEHLPRPLATLRRVADLLRPGGLLYIETPNIDSLSFRWSREYWFGLDPPRHLWLFSPTTLTLALEKCGFTIDRLTTRSSPWFDWEAAYKREERDERLGPELRPLVHGWRPRVERRALPRSLLLTTLSRTAGLFSWRSREVLSCWANSGTTY
jgi:SAM-dependent methyltransferase